MTTEQEKAYEAWWNGLAIPVSTSTKSTFFAGWGAARSDIHQEIMDMAIVAFRDGADETARLYRDLATELFNKV